MAWSEPPIPVLMAQWFSSGDGFASQGTFDHVWRQLVVITGGKGCYWEAPTTKNSVVYDVNSAEVEKPEAVSGEQGRWGCWKGLRSPLSLPAGAALRHPVEVSPVMGEVCASQTTLLSNSREKLIKHFKRLLNYNPRST